MTPTPIANAEFPAGQRPLAPFPQSRVPIIQAPMAGAQGSAMTMAVCRAGGIGSLPCAMLTPDSLRQELETIHAAVQGPYNVNFFCHAPPVQDAAREAAWAKRLKPFYNELGLQPPAGPAAPARAPFSAALADVLEPFKPPIVSFHFGLPDARLLARVKSWGSQVWSSATTVDEALWLQAQGVDAVIAQGLEAGGHRGHFLSHDLSLQMGTFALLPQIVQAVRVPVIAAGGIADSAGVRAALALGARAVQVGTAFLLSDEATTSAIHRRALASPAARHTALTNVFTGRPARGITNRLMRELGYLCQDAPAFPLATAGMAPLRAQAEAGGSGDFTPLWSGQNAQGCQAGPAADIVARLAR